MAYTEFTAHHAVYLYFLDHHVKVFFDELFCVVDFASIDWLRRVDIASYILLLIIFTHQVCRKLRFDDHTKLTLA